MSLETINNDEPSVLQEVDLLPRIEDAAHELTNVLQIIRGYVSYASKNLPKENECLDDLQQALIATNRAAQIAHQLLDVSRTEKVASSEE